MRGLCNAVYIWRVTVKHSGELLYAGPGPVVQVESPAPF